MSCCTASSWACSPTSRLSTTSSRLGSLHIFIGTDDDDGAHRSPERCVHNFHTDTKSNLYVCEQAQAVDL
eukprot:1158099-Pelagomonas_calceolata.AAC.11